MMLIPFFLYILVGFAKPARLREDFGCSLWPLLGVLILLVFQTSFEGFSPQKTWLPFGRVKPLKAFGAALLIWEFAYVVAFFFQAFFSVHLTGDMRRFQFPMEELGRACEKIWEDRVDGDCPYVTGDWWLAGNAARHMTPIPTVHAFGQFGDMRDEIAVSTWSTDEDVNRRGGLVLWGKNDDSDELRKFILRRFPRMEMLSPLALRYSKAYHFDSTEIPLEEICVGIVEPERNATH